MSPVKMPRLPKRDKTSPKCEEEEELNKAKHGLRVISIKESTTNIIER